MISREFILEHLQDFLDNKGLFVIDIHISSQNDIELTIDGDKYVTIDDCAEVSRYIERFLNRDIEDFSLSVSSPDANKPLKFPRQYPKHIGKEIHVYTSDNKEIKGKLLTVNPDEIVVLAKVKEKVNNKKKITEREIKISFDTITKAKILLPF